MVQLLRAKGGGGPAAVPCCGGWSCSRRRTAWRAQIQPDGRRRQAGPGRKTRPRCSGTATATTPLAPERRKDRWEMGEAGGGAGAGARGAGRGAQGRSWAPGRPRRSSVVGLLVINSFNFPLSENIFISPFWLKDSFTRPPFL